MSAFIYFDESGDEVEASLPKLPVNCGNVDDIDLSTIRDMNAGIDYHYINFNLSSGRVSKWKFFSLEKRQVAYTKILSVMNKVDSDEVVSEQTAVAPAGYLIGVVNGVNQDFTTNVPYVAGTTKLYLNGQRLYTRRDYDEVPETNGIHFYTAPEAAQAIICDFKPQP